MGTNYKVALTPQRIRDTIHGWGKEDTSTVISVEEYDHHEFDSPRAWMRPSEGLEIELQPHTVLMTGDNSSLALNGELSAVIKTICGCNSILTRSHPGSWTIKLMVVTFLNKYHSACVCVNH
ncbi:seven transmembrane MLO family protein [Artemisia annua]|uniref:Seven transmembrane MLO family protein n=1 Tax=Artemisia annua TaxID=35608 RepID=A0A2U1NJG5_ARTAN|nr:seven transmembrane MLO family protein [Artemisia annua]